MLVVPLRFLRGYVSFCVKGKFPERFLNITNKYGIGLWGVTPVDGGFEAFMYVSDYKTIRTTARKSRVTLKIKEKYGCLQIVPTFDAFCAIINKICIL